MSLANPRAPTRFRPSIAPLRARGKAVPRAFNPSRDVDASSSSCAWVHDPASLQPASSSFISSVMAETSIVVATRLHDSCRHHHHSVAVLRITVLVSDRAVTACPEALEWRSYLQASSSLAHGLSISTSSSCSRPRRRLQIDQEKARSLQW
ncbi:hypothetical protein F2Q70_00036685 [Brassica cretica]|uniref:Uncharacterized protein n=1 Tax=Brassica cretica TaxID=69181 RepID=A0A8S9JW41_BRACR|nr:hypothetical protein F2Q70_00036685 [Brassica cretica]